MPAETNSHVDWAKAIAEMRDPLPMEPEIWAAGADLDTAHFVARMLRQQGYYLVRPDDIGWPDIRSFQEELHRGQGVREDGGGFFVRCILRLSRIKSDPVETYQEAARRMLQERERA